MTDCFKEHVIGSCFDPDRDVIINPAPGSSSLKLQASLTAFDGRGSRLRSFRSFEQVFNGWFGRVEERFAVQPSIFEERSLGQFVAQT